MFHAAVTFGSLALVLATAAVALSPNSEEFLPDPALIKRTFGIGKDTGRPPALPVG